MPAELGEFDECFITGTAAEVTPVGEIGPHHYNPARSPRRSSTPIARKSSRGPRPPKAKISRQKARASD